MIGRILLIAAAFLLLLAAATTVVWVRSSAPGGQPLWGAGANIAFVVRGGLVVRTSDWTTVTCSDDQVVWRTIRKWNHLGWRLERSRFVIRDFANKTPPISVGSINELDVAFPSLGVLFFVLGLGFTVVARVLSRREQMRKRSGVCRRCGYNLTGNASGVCPECGTPTFAIEAIT